MTKPAIHAPRTAPPGHGRALAAGFLLGAVPGVLIVLIAQLVIEGEQQLTFGVLGMWLAIIGAAAGLLVMLRRTGRRR
jgi:hypothetical protein